MKQRSVFFPQRIRRRLQQNGEAVRRQLDAASWWRERSCAELSRLMFSPTIKRSWMVRSDGSCPACRGHVPMYEWVVDARRRPWKLSCPHCGEEFPKNDFEAFYRSGVDEEGVFRREDADESLLVGPDGGSFGVDDGSGYVDEEGRRYRFVGTYLVYGQWMQLVREGIARLAFAYCVTDDPEYARRAAVLLYTVARRFPEFDYHTQGMLYEEEYRSRGYITYWASTPRDLHTMAIAYDMIFDALGAHAGDDDAMVPAGGAELTDGARPGDAGPGHGVRITGDATPDGGVAPADGAAIEEAAPGGAAFEQAIGVDAAGIRQAVESRILREALCHRDRYVSNPPHTDFAVAVMSAVLGWPENREEVLGTVDRIIDVCTAVDGLSGEKGLAGYASIAPSTIADMLMLFSNLSEGFLEEMFDRHPVLRKTYGFHLDTWYMERYYPGVGDAAGFGSTTTEYPATLRTRQRRYPYLPSRDWFTFRLSEILEDPDFAKAVYHSNGGEIENCFVDDIYVPDPTEIRNRLREVIERHGPDIRRSSVLYPEWRIAVLHSGTGPHRRMLCINYDSGANHAHEDALNIGLFFRGYNMLPDFGYPPVHLGGWSSDEFRWYRSPASHNLVVIDGHSHENLAKGTFLRYPVYGSAVLRGADTWAQVVHADAKEYAGVERYERTVALVDIDETRSYCLDVFRVSGGEDHAQFFRTPPAKVHTKGLETEEGEDYGHRTFMRGFRTDERPGPDVRVDFVMEHPPSDTAGLGLAMLPVTEGAGVTLCESWVDITRVTGSGADGTLQELWIPTLMVRKSGPQSTFLTVIEPYEAKSVVRSVRRLPAEQGAVALEVVTDKLTDRILVQDAQHPATVSVAEGELTTDGWFAVSRRRNGEHLCSTYYGGSFLDDGG